MMAASPAAATAKTARTPTRPTSRLSRESSVDDDDDEDGDNADDEPSRQGQPRDLSVAAEQRTGSLFGWQLARLGSAAG